MTILNLTSEIFTRTVEDIITREELEQRLKEKKPLRVKLGIDATGVDLHVGHAVNLWKMRGGGMHYLTQRLSKDKLK